jgi:hypothetical protein
MIAFVAMFDQNGPANFSGVFDEYQEAYLNLTIAAGTRVDLNLVDTTARTGYRMINVKPRTPHEMAVEYYTFDWEYAQTPEVIFSSISLSRVYSLSDFSNLHGLLHLGYIIYCDICFFHLVYR